jgi:hypothetical protein
MQCFAFEKESQGARPISFPFLYPIRAIRVIRGQFSLFIRGSEFPSSTQQVSA